MFSIYVSFYNLRFLETQVIPETSTDHARPGFKPTNIGLKVIERCLHHHVSYIVRKLVNILSSGDGLANCHVWNAN